MTPDDEEIPQFPISRGTSPINRANNGLRLLNQPVREAVLALTPDPTAQQADRHPLILLNKMGNRDKHRKLTLLALSHSVSAAINDDLFSLHVYGGDILEVGAEPVRIVEYTGTLGSNSQISPTPEIQFGQGCEVVGMRVGSTLRWIHDHIRDAVFQSLEQHL
jgi:hypothetical protein